MKAFPLLAVSLVFASLVASAPESLSAVTPKTTEAEDDSPRLKRRAPGGEGSKLQRKPTDSHRPETARQESLATQSSTSSSGVPSRSSSSDFDTSTSFDSDSNTRFQEPAWERPPRNIRRFEVQQKEMLDKWRDLVKRGKGNRLTHVMDPITNRRMTMQEYVSAHDNQYKGGESSSD